MIKRIVKKSVAFLLLVFGTMVEAQDLTLEMCHKMAKENYPAVKQYGLIDKSKDFTIDNLHKGYWPQISITGQATYQSDVTAIPLKIPGIDIPTLSKDQYKLYADINQTIYDGGIIKTLKETARGNADVQQGQLEVELYKIEDRVNQLFFGILMVNAQIDQTNTLNKDIQSGIDKTKAAISNGTAFRSTLDVLLAEQLKLDQRSVELKASKRAFLDMLGYWIAKDLNENTTFKSPVQDVTILGPDIKRPELSLYELQKKNIDVQEKLISAKLQPKVGLFVQAGLGKPALNMLSNDFEPYYLGGLRLNWSISGFYTSKKEREIYEINRMNIDVQKDVFLFNTNLSVRQQNSEVSKLQALIKTDDEIISLRTSIKNTALAQLENGVITTSDYLRETNAEDQARQAKILHQIQLLLAAQSLKWTTNNR